MTSPDEGPEWANEAHLDEVFSTWVPGPPDSASAAEKEMAGDNPRLELPAEDDISDEDMDAALAAALAEAELLTAGGGAEAPDGEVMTETGGEFEPGPQPEPQRVERSEPAGPSWLNIAEPEAAPAPPTSATVTPAPVFEPSPDQVVDVATSEAALGSGEEPAFVDGEPEPASAFEPEQAGHAGMPAFDPPPPPEPARPSRPWTRSDDDILPGRKGKGRRR